MDEHGPLPELTEILQSRPSFGHREHIQLAWTFLSVAGLPVAEDRMREAIRHLAAAHATPSQYHETLTLAWTRLIAAHLRSSHAETFEEFIAENPILLDKRITGHFFSDAVLESEAARRAWIEPDLRPLPAISR